MIEGRALEGVAIACARECERQQVDAFALGSLIHAYAYALSRAHEAPDLEPMHVLAAMINENPGVSYRKVPVTFASGGTAVDWREVPDATERLWKMWMDPEAPLADRLATFRQHPVPSMLAADMFMKALLEIHPFIDGNGRVAFVLRNWLRGSLENPEPLPDYFGDG